MPKSKVIKEAVIEDEENRSASDAASEGPSTTLKKRHLDGSDEQLTKKAKIETERVTAGSAGESKECQDKTHLTNTGGDKYIDLGKKKRATVRSFKGIPLLDIREYYGGDGQEKPGKKGISLTLDQWEALRENASTIDQLFSTQKK